ncbi:platelet-activating factor acetylhydrolase, isoform II-domain-containing protein [Lophiotrema nucula]|uniref:1-alkyl-2-acetylglycerophosphocholine esterase n=1 Tax=Lophiotrema nucula TaxID=690887 RepID=A0A6A5YXX4_9PLEO|nr:platelet-activating factor acetylhydrolase, isoform II-domain-containing protein [Lophiotrema nucula]
MSIPAHITGARNELRRTTSAIGGTGQVPNAKKPRSRPPTSTRDKLGFLQGHLPPYSGPYSVGCMEFEIPAANPRVVSHIKREGHHLLKLETVLFTLYYPAGFGTGVGKDPAGRRTWSRETWLPRPRVQTAKGYGKFAGLPDWFSVPFCASTTMFTKLRAFRNAPPAQHWPPEGNSKSEGHKVKNEHGPPPRGKDEEPVFPLLFFSHGLGGTRTCYSTMCGEFASYGFVVCAMEHRDGSGPRTFVNHAKEGDGSMEDQEKHGIDHSEKDKRRGYDKLDYIFPENNPMDTAPNNEKGVDAELRSAQIELRMEEIEEAYRVLCQIAAGNGEEVARRNLRTEGYIGSSSRGLQGVQWSLWKNRFHIDKVTISGHSFGAATVVEVLRNTDRFENVQAGIIYDIWGAPIKPPEDDPRHRIHLPILGVNSEAFMYWQKNFDAVMSLMKESSEQGAPAFLCTVRGSVHLSQSDFTLLYPHLCSMLLKSTVNPQRAIDLNISASLEFLRDVTEGAGKSIIERCLTDEELLQRAPLDTVPDDNKPDDEWIGARIKIPHEFRTRLMAKVQRKIKRQRKGEKYNSGDEMWMHFRPDAKELADWRRKHASSENPVKREIEGDSESGPQSDSDNNEPPVLKAESGVDHWLGHPPLLNADNGNG